MIINSTIPAPTIRALVNSQGSPVVSATPRLLLPKADGVVNAAATRTIVGQPVFIFKIPRAVFVTYPAQTAFGGNLLHNYTVTRSDFRLVRGVQNEINFYVRDLDRKPVALGNTETLTIKIVDRDTDTLLMSRNLTTIDSSKGIYLLTVLPSEMDQWPTTALSWSISYTRADSTTVLLWTDQAYSPYSTTTVTTGPDPGPTQPVITMWADLMQLSDNNYYTSLLTGAGRYGYQDGTQTFNIYMTNFLGSIRIDASLAANPLDDPSSPDWFQVDMVTYTSAFTGSVVLNEQGTYIWMRAVVIPNINNTGTVDQIQYKS